MRQYLALIHKEGDSDYGVSFPNFPGCFTAGKNLEETRAMARDALDLHIEGMIAEGLPVPDPSTLDEVMAERKNRDAVVLLVSARRARPRVARVNVTLPEALLARIDAVADNRSAFLVRVARQALKKSA